MRAKDLPRAIKVFTLVIEDKGAEKALVAEAMFWCGDCYMKLKKPDYTNAYRMLKKLIWDYPESKWAKHARGVLLTGPMRRIEQADFGR